MTGPHGMDSRRFCADGRPRARGLSVAFPGQPGPWNAITDVPGLEVGYVTLVSGSGPLVVGEGPVRTGVTAILPRGRAGVGDPCAAGWCSLNGNGEMTGTTWIDEVGAVSLPIVLTNTHAVGSCHRGVIDWVVKHHPSLATEWLLPVVAETWDGYLNDINGNHVRPAHTEQALDACAAGPLLEGSVGGGTGMSCYGFKGGSGTSSRVVPYGPEHYTVGVFVQANFGARHELTVAGVRLGTLLAEDDPLGQSSWLVRDAHRAGMRPGAGSVIAVVATDAPLLPGQCKALSRRVPLGLARTGTASSHFSGDIFLAFSTANPGALTSRFPHGEPGPSEYETLRFIPWGRLDPFYTAVVEAVEEAVLNALVVNSEMVGRDGHRVPALPHEVLLEGSRRPGP